MRVWYQLLVSLQRKFKMLCNNLIPSYFSNETYKVYTPGIEINNTYYNT